MPDLNRIITIHLNSYLLLISGEKGSIINNIKRFLIQMVLSLEFSNEVMVNLGTGDMCGRAGVKLNI